VSGPIILDASAMLAVLRGEPGGDVVIDSLHGGKLSAVNCSEVLQKAELIGAPHERTLATIASFDVEIVDFTVEHAAICASLITQTKAFGLSLADRACLALGIAMNGTVLTADRKWAQLEIAATVRLIR
jgi:PIN domain nuclease of toxin-antitoxin system